jgi:hypothetical protein
MKVYLGPYKSWFGPYQLAELLCFWVKPVKDEHGYPSKPAWVHKFGELLAYGSIKPEPSVGDVSDIFEDARKPTWLNRFLSWIHSKQSRTILVRIDRYDTWSMDATLGYIIRPMLYKLRADKHGAPYVDDEDVTEHLRSTAAPPKENEYDTDANHFLRWDYVLDEMIFAFDSLDGGPNQDWENQFTAGKYDFRFKKLDESGTSEMVRGPNHTAETDWEARKEYGKRIQNGFRLFGKYYQSLWD